MHESRHVYESVQSLLFVMFNCVFYTDSQRITLSCVDVKVQVLGRIFNVTENNFETYR